MIYLFRNPETGEVIEVEQRMNDRHVYKKDGILFERIFSLPQLATEGFKHDPFSVNQFLQKTNKAGKLGDLMDRAEDLAKERVEKAGYDPLQAGYEEKYSKARGGAKLEKKLEDINITI